MTRPVSLFRFIDGPLMDQAARRAEVVRRMAKDLVAACAIDDRDDAIDVLIVRDYPSLDIFALIDDARQVAMQTQVSAEMTSHDR